MHQDKKVGLALALLVIGFVGAFCLRQNQNTTVEIPELNDPHYLDEQIADKDRTPYFGTKGKEGLNTQLGNEQTLTGMTDEQKPAGSNVAVPTISHSTPVSRTDPKASKAERWGEMPDFLKEIDLPEEQFTSAELSDSVFEPNPTQPEAEPASQGTTLRPIQSETESIKPAHNNAWDVNPAQQRREPPRPADSRQAPQIRIHTVKSGETLSEISIRYLGTSRRYKEIFNLNRDRLRSPNDIREGMQLRIPVQQPAGATPQSANSQSSTATSARSGKRTIGQMVSQPTLKKGSSTVQFEGLIESLSNAPDQSSLKDLDQQQTMQQLQKTLKSGTLTDGKNGTNAIPKNYRKFIPVPRSPLTPQAGSQARTQGAGKSLSQVQPENVDEIVDELFDKLSDSPQQSNKTAKLKTYTIKKGDTLESIAVRIYGKRSAAFKIYQKNRDLLKSAHYIRPGMKLELP
ncbi:LysM peptidoglycan-binding domain-containing protein [Gimesia fumaroli]|uniref:LysM domain/BON superfamily protein n=1 Tax=Gimesia fumaroli TaxID=2527976 RepID=A0A518IBF0_9PLAN|nr:LysM peptidoglycan-binding domain-containing protein [Gimesia fumaroli]QDV50433.1 LysM domain/BON superfamily protein [Gimesia fumaroli]